MKKFFLLFAFMLMCVFCIKAQLYYFVKSGTEVTSDTRILLVYVSGTRLYSSEANKASEISAKLHSNSSYWEDWMYKILQKYDEHYKYDSSLSTSSYDVYKCPWRGMGNMALTNGVYGPRLSYFKGSQIGDLYYGISSDGRTCIKWKQRKDSDEVLERTYWERIDTDILNKDPHDFLR